MSKYSSNSNDKIVMAVYNHMDTVMSVDGVGIDFLYGARKKSDNSNTAVYVNSITDSDEKNSHGLNLVYVDIYNKHQENNLERLTSIFDAGVITDWGNIDIRDVVFKALDFPCDNKDIVIGDYRLNYKTERKIPTLTDYSFIRIILNVVINY